MVDEKNSSSVQSLKEIFEEFEKTSRIPASGLSRENCLNYARVSKLLDIIDKVKKSIINQFQEFGELEINITPTFEISEPICNAASFSLSEDHNSGTKHLSVSQNFNFNKLASLPGPEAYACVYYPLYNSVLKRISSKTQQEDVDFHKKGQEKTGSNHAVSTKNYLTQFLSNEFSKLYDKIDNPVIKSIVQIFLQNEITDDVLFDNPKGQNLLAERFIKVVKQDSLQQATFLLGEFSGDSKNGLNIIQPADESQIREFCERYVKTVLAGAGLKESAVKLTFESKGDIGQYTDYGTYQELNINLQKISKLKNPAEIVMTLSHELTHAIDSSANKAMGNTEAGGYGLLDNLVGDSKQDLKKLTNEPEEVVRYFKDLNKICYHVNPNERSARLGELSAIRFMQNMHPDSKMQEYIQKSINSYKREQERVVQSINSVNDIQAKYIEIKNLASSDTQMLIEERLNYLSSLQSRGLLNAEQEIQSIAIAMNSQHEVIQANMQESQISQLGAE